MPEMHMLNVGEINRFRSWKPGVKRVVRLQFRTAFLTFTALMNVQRAAEEGQKREEAQEQDAESASFRRDSVAPP